MCVCVCVVFVFFGTRTAASGLQRHSLTRILGAQPPGERTDGAFAHSTSFQVATNAVRSLTASRRRKQKNIGLFEHVAGLALESLTQLLIFCSLNCFSQSLAHSLAHSLALAHSTTHSTAHSPTHSTAQSLAHSRTHSLTHSPSLTHSRTHALTQLLTQRLTHSPQRFALRTPGSSCR